MMVLLELPVCLLPVESGKLPPSGEGEVLRQNAARERGPAIPLSQLSLAF